MPDLGEYLGHLLCEVTRARVMADHEAVRTATAYLGDGSGLLRHFPVPRMRLPELELTVPVVVMDIPDGYAEVTRVDPRLLSKLLANNLGPALSRQRVQIETGEITRIILEDPMLSEGRLSPDALGLLGVRIQDRTRSISKSPRLAGSTAERFEEIARIIRDQIARTVEALPRRPAGIAVDARTAAVKNVGEPAMVVNIKLVVREESLEIFLSDREEGDTGPRIAKLVPE
jgi:hypothetical protein